MQKRNELVPDISVVIPILNEEGSIKLLYEKLETVLIELTNGRFEVLMVDDGSTDSSWKVICSLTEKHKRVEGIRLRRNFGKSIALFCGFEIAKGNLIVTMDGDLQDDPAEMPKLIDKINKGYDVVSGWKQKRQDPWHKVLPSHVFNTIITSLFGIYLRDINSGYKVYKSEVVKKLEIYGDLHRFIPVLASSMGYSITEVPVKHNPRKYGRSKYGMGRFVNGFIDLFTILTLTKYRSRPSHLIGGIGFLLGMTGALSLSYLFVLWLTGGRPIGDRPLLLFGIMCMVMSVQLISLGIISEMINSRSTRNVEQYICQKE